MLQLLSMPICLKSLINVDMLQEKFLTNFSLQATVVARAASIRHEQARADQIHMLSAELHAKHGIAVTIHLHILCTCTSADAAVMEPLVPLLSQVTVHSPQNLKETAAGWIMFCTDSSKFSAESTAALQDIPTYCAAQDAAGEFCGLLSTCGLLC